MQRTEIALVIVLILQFYHTHTHTTIYVCVCDKILDIVYNIIIILYTMSKIYIKLQ